MYTQSTPLKIFTVYGGISLALVFGLGTVVGLYINPVYNSITNQDLQRDLDHTQANLHQRKLELKDKLTLTNEFCNTYKTAK